MPVPSFPDVGKKLRELFDEGYPFGLIKLTSRGTTCSTRRYFIDAYHSFDPAGNFIEALTSRKYPSWGIGYVSKFNTKGQAATDIQYRDPNFLVSIGGDFNIDTKEMKDRMNLQFRNDYLTIDLKGAGGSEPTPFVLTGSFICGFKQYLTGIQLAYDITGGSILSTNALAGYRNCGIGLTAALSNSDTLMIGLHYRPPTNEGCLEGGLLTRFKLDSFFSSDPQNSSPPEIEGAGGPDSDKSSTDAKPSEQLVTQVGIKYKMGKYNSFRAKIDSEWMIGLAQDIRVKEEVTLTLGLLINGKNFWEGDVGGHKVGLGVDFKG